MDQLTRAISPDDGWVPLWRRLIEELRRMAQEERAENLGVLR